MYEQDLPEQSKDPASIDTSVSAEARRPFFERVARFASKPPATGVPFASILLA
jgi:hypothetical protein